MLYALINVEYHRDYRVITMRPVHMSIDYVYTSVSARVCLSVLSASKKNISGLLLMGFVRRRRGSTLRMQ